LVLDSGKQEKKQKKRAERATGQNNPFGKTTIFTTPLTKIA
jgi:hypothetical protein